MPNSAGAWQFWIDRGGTFTDIVAVTPRRELLTTKLLSDNPSQYPDAAIEGIARLLASRPELPRSIAAVKMGTTVATNALLERRGASTVFVTTRGLGDILRIGYQQRPDLFALEVRLPSMLYSSVIEADERIAADGSIVRPLDERALEAALIAARADGAVSVAIAFMHAYRYPQHERRAAAAARRAGFTQVALSHEVSPSIRIVERGDTTVADAYLTPGLHAYVDSVRSRLVRDFGNPELLFMQSHGGLIDADRFRGYNSVLSGPAGGVVGMTRTAAQAGFDQVVGFDMGGTSTDVSVYAGGFERAGKTTVAGVRIAAPMMRINTVAAGGGSVLRFDSGRLQVGPESAGADPGPACYRNGGPLTLTDANVCLGRIQPDFFPSVFGPDADRPIDVEAARARLGEIAESVNAGRARTLDETEIAAGFLRIAVDHMAGAISKISVQRGHDIRRFALSSFGGAGGQHACRVADALGIDTVIIDPLAGVLSAYGIGVADVRSIARAPIERRLDARSARAVGSEARRLAADLLSAGAKPEVAGAELDFEHRAHMRVAGSDTLVAVTVEIDSTAAELVALFEDAYRGRFGFAPDTESIVVENVEVEAVRRLPHPERPKLEESVRTPQAVAHRDVWFEAGWQETAIYSRVGLRPGDTITGPAIIAEENATTVVEIDWRARVDRDGALVIERSRPRRQRSDLGVERDPVTLEVFNNQFMQVAEQMGAVLEQTAHSVNIKERLDYSCALFDARGDLVANAPHVPVHLGSMSDSIKTVLAAAGPMRAGDAYLINAPYSGGTHLPDITVVSPFFEPGAEAPSYIVASRAHHADVGGRTPGSMPARSTNIDEEGIVFECTPIVRDGTFLEREIRSLLGGGRYPARNPDQNIADLKAQLAANTKGLDEIARLLGRFGPETVRSYMQHVQDNAEECVRAAIGHLSDGACSVDLDGGEHIAVEIRIDPVGRSAKIDFSGTGAMSPANFNAPASIARAVVLYVFRTLVAHDIPLNSGCLKPLQIVLPEGSLLSPRYPAAVVAGNVETSQCIADALLAALGAEAASQGTMNNFTFGDAEHQYYETICGGCGAGPGFDGASAVHSHMTNSRLTDPEVIEHRYPVRIVRFAIRRGSGGAGRWHGGEGVIREFEFLAPLRGSILSNRRTTAPHGLAGGGDGQPGRNYLRRRSGALEDCGSAEDLEFGPGDVFVIETPGGGGYGS